MDILTSNNVCIGSESNVPPVIIRCDYPDSSDNRDALASVNAVLLSSRHSRNRERRADRRFGLHIPDALCSMFLVCSVSVADATSPLTRTSGTSKTTARASL